MSDGRWLSWACAVGMSAALSGCVDDAGSGPQSGQIGGVYVAEACDEEAEEIGNDDVSPLGFSASEVVSSLAGERSAPLTWEKGGSTTATVSVGAPLAARFVRSKPAEGGPEPAGGSGAALDCSDHLEIDVALDFATEDGAFAESLPVTLRVAQEGAAGFHHELDVGALEGSYQITEVDPSQYREVKVYLTGTLTSSAVSGSVHGSAESHPSGSGPDTSVSALLFTVAQF